MARTVRRFWPVLFLALLGALLLVLASRLPSLAKGIEPGPEVHALVRIDRQPPRLLEGTPKEPFNAAEADEYCRTQAFMIRTRLVLNAALRHPGIGELAVIRGQKDPLGWLEKHVRAELLDTPGVLRVSVNAGTPQEQAALTNAIVDAYIEEAVNRERIQAQKQVDQLREFAKRYEDRVKSNRRTMRTVQEQIGAGDKQAVELRQQLAVQEVKFLHGERLKAQAELRKLRLEREDRDDRTETPAAEEEVEKGLKQDPELIRLQEAVARMESDLADIARVSVKPEKDPAHAALQDRVKAAKTILEKRREELRRPIVAQVQERQRGKQREAGQQLESRIRLLEKLSAQLSAEMARATKESQGIVKGHLDLEDIRQDISHLEEMAHKLKTRAEKLTIELEAPPRVYRLQEASAPR